MSEESTYDAAVSAFSALEGNENQPQPVDTPQVNEQVEQQAPEVQPPEEPVASINVDLSDLPEESQIILRARQREMERGMHEKFREANELRTQAESAIQFVEALNSDPNFAYQVLSRLNEGLSASGYLSNEGQQAPDSPDEFYGQPEYEEYAGSDPYADRIAQLEAQQTAFAEQVYQERLTAHLDNQLAQIRNDHPDWGQDDIQSIIDRGFTTNGDLFQAAELYQAENDRILARYLKEKGSVKAPPRVSAGNQGTEAPESLTGMSETQRRQYILDRILAGE